jgi:thioesterase domain-containing protein
VTALEPSWPIYGLQPRGLDGALVPHATVEAAAASYLRALDLDRPVHLLGHSFGGWIAFEMAAQLRASGREVASLTIVDSDAPSHTSDVVECTAVEVLLHLISVLEQSAGRSLGITRADLEARDDDERRALLHARLVGANVLPRRSTADVLRGPIRVFAACARTQYTPRVVDPSRVRLVLLHDPRLGAAATHRQHQAAAAGWRAWAPQLSIWEGPGNHMTAFHAPHVALLADWLREQVLTPADSSAAHAFR